MPIAHPVTCNTTGALISVANIATSGVFSNAVSQPNASRKGSDRVFHGNVTQHQFGNDFHFLLRINWTTISAHVISAYGSLYL